MDEIPNLLPIDTVNPKAIPVTIITGFLGSGKTTLVMRLLNDPTHKKRIAVVLNEFGSSSGIDKSLFMGQDGQLSEEWLELSNGCFCCSVKDMGVKAVENLIKKNRNIDYILLETTGLADPGMETVYVGPIASMFWLDAELQSEIYLDGIVTVVDAKYIDTYLTQEQMNEATKQIALADRVIVNKVDLVTNIKVQELKSTIRSINNMALISTTCRADIPIDFLFDLHCFDGKTIDPFSDINKSTHFHNDTITTVMFEQKGVVIRDRLEKWLQSLLWEKSVFGLQTNVLRFKALIHMENSEKKHVVQAVQELYDVQLGDNWSSKDRINKLVFIGSGLDVKVLQESFQECVL